jgi:hypothetical protein
MMVDIGAQHDRAQGPHQKTRAEGHQRRHELRELAAAGEEDLSDRARVVAEHEEVVHLQEIAAGDADHRPDLLSPVGPLRHGRSP